MAKAACSDDEFRETLKKLGPARTARRFGVSERSVHGRRLRLEARSGVVVPTPFGQGDAVRDQPDYPDHIPVTIKNGIILVGSDAHIWPGDRSPAIRAFIQFIKEYGPRAVYLNGDVLDFPRISRHAPIGWEKNPQPVEEIEAAQEVCHDIEQAAGRGVRKIWPIGNHDQRFETKIATNCPEYAMIKGIHLHDHFPAWECCWMSIVNEAVVIKHRFKGGMHAPHNNALWAGTHIITGHLHWQKAAPIRTLKGLHYGIDTGTLANVYAKQFRNYTEENPRSWVSGFGVFTFVDGVMLPPEFVTVMGPHEVAFRGKIIKV